ncbi:MAG: EamA/RhaT family transporter, partial [Clostridiales bacterium]|nr:EamA/RhaT family transporter [Clostridiales bacterium]
MNYKRDKTREIRSKLHIVIAMMAFSTIGVFVKNINLSSAEIALWRGVFALNSLLILLIISKKLSDIYKIKKGLNKLILSGIAMGFNWVFLFEAYNYTSVALSTLSY